MATLDQQQRPVRARRMQVDTIDKVFDPGNVITEVSPNDEMYQDDPDWYFQLGEVALHNIGLGMLATRRVSFWRILDLPSGHGRVLRTLKAAFPHAQLTACDIDSDGVEFCARVLGATPIVSRDDPAEIELNGPFDLIWCGSLLTHLDADRWPGFLGLFERNLAEYGLLVFSTHGRFAAEMARLGKYNFGLHDAPLSSLMEGYERDGFGYAEYVDDLKDRLDIPTYGVSLTSPQAVFDQVAQHPLLRVISYAERAWGGHDVVTCLREPIEGLGAVQVEREAKPPPKYS
jgi:trans-aconitate methyltransferase